jgi:ceramide glucosyltransferase
VTLIALVQILSGAGLAVSLAYSAFAIIRVASFRRAANEPATEVRPAVTIAKPVCGVDADLEANLRSFCQQEYPQYQVIFGIRDPADPAGGLVRRIVEECKGRDVSLVADSRIVGANLKVSNLIHIARAATGEIIAVVDSDMRVGPEYLRRIVAPFADEGVGAVTCLYTGTPAAGLASILGSMFINEVFLPSVLVSLALQPLAFCFGATMAVRRSALEAIGGFEALADYLADDYMLGHLVRAAGLRVELAPYVVENIVSEPTLRGLFEHELRWARTIRSVRPLGYAFSVLTMATPWAMAFLLASRFSALGWFGMGAALFLRAGLHVVVRLRFRPGRMAAPWWIPARDVLSFIVYCSSHFGRSVLWKETRFSVSTDGQLHEEGART